MTRKAAPLLALLVLLFAGGLVYYTWLSGDSPAAADDSDAGAGKAQVPEPKRLSGGGGGPNRPPPVSMEADPEGDLRLEGQVIDEYDDPIAGAVVRVDSNPPKTTESRGDGTFHFDDLIGKSYQVSARKENLVGGPVQRRLTESSDPVILRVIEGASLEVTVLDAENSEPIGGARVETEDRSEVTDASGKVTLPGFGSGYAALEIRADGYAPKRELVQIPQSPAVKVTSVVRLRGGAPVSGRVVDGDGAAVAGARVVAQDASSFFPLGDSKEGARTGDEGRFSIPVVAEGTYRFVAHHEGYPPGSSEPISVDGQRATEDVEIVLEAGATLAGTVVDEAGSPVPWATIRVRTRRASAQGWSRGIRGATSDEEGAFEITGLPRRPVVVAARSETASSELVDVDLTGKEEARDVLLTLEIGGVIAGVVVDGSGEPVADAQVIAFPDFWGGGDIEGFMLRGSSSQTTDGGGNFRFQGLPEGTYRLHASRAAASGDSWWQQRGDRAKTGDTEVELELLEKGALTGRLQYEDGSAPQVFTVSVGYPPGVPVSDEAGAFRVPSVHPGTHDVTFRGPGFAETVQRDVEVTPGQEVDLGTVTVKRGRSVSGRVLDAGGSPVAGAKVIVGRQVVGDGKSVAASSFGAAADEFMGIRRGETDGAGEYRITGIGSRKLVLAAEHPERGRSFPVELPPGTDSPRVDLTLRPFGKLSGRVSSGGEPVGGAQVTASASGSTRSTILVTTGGDGTYHFEKLAEGTYTVTAIAGAGLGGGRTGSARASVAGGQEARADIEIPKGDITLEVRVKGEGGAEIDASQVFLFDGAVRATNAEELQRLFTASGEGGGAMISFSMGAKPAVLEEVTPGEKSLCVIPLSGDLEDPSFMQRIQQNASALDVHCRQHEVAEAPDEQSIALSVPPMSPLPEPDDEG